MAKFVRLPLFIGDFAYGFYFYEAIMLKIHRFIIWICKHFNHEEILKIIDELIKVVNNENPDLKPRDAFKEKHPNYRDYSVDPLAPLYNSEVAKPKKT